MAIIDKINYCLQHTGTSGAEMSRDLGLSNSTYSQWNTGKAFPSRKNIGRIAIYFGVSVEWFYTEEDPISDPFVKQEKTSTVDRIRDLCLERKVSIKYLERAVGLDGGSIIKWDQSYPSVDQIQRVADYFNVSVDYLLGREKNELPVEPRQFDNAEALRSEFMELIDTMQDEELAHLLAFMKARNRS